MCKPRNRGLPFDFKEKLKKNGLNTLVFEAANERHLLNQFLCKIQNLDPDIYVVSLYLAELKRSALKRMFLFFSGDYPLKIFNLL